MTCTENRTITVGDKTYQVTPIFCSDMALLVEVLGLYCVFNDKAHVKCCFCDCTRDKMGDFSHERWPLRNPELWEQREKEVCALLRKVMVSMLTYTDTNM